MNKPTLFLFVLLLFLFFSRVSFSQDYLVHQYSEPDGLPSVLAYGISQDQWGRMWFATRSGIAVYDGISWETPTVQEGLPIVVFRKITVDQKGRVWALSEPGWEETFVVYHSIHEENVKPLGNKNNIIKMEIPRKTRFTSFQVIPTGFSDQPIIVMGTTNRGVFVWQQGQLKNLTTAHGLLSNTVNGMVLLNRKLYAATDQGISVIIFRDDSFALDNQLNHLLDLPSREIKGIGIEHKDRFPDFPLPYSRIWLYGRHWLGYFGENNFKIIRYPLKILFRERKEVVHLLPDYRGGLYVGNVTKVNYFNYKSGSWESLGVSNNLIGEGVNSMFIDREKNIWIACDRGVSKISSRRFSVLQRSHGLLEDEVSAVLEYNPGKFILGHNSGFTFYDGKQFSIMPYLTKRESGSSELRVLDMHLDSQKNIWAAASNAGLARISPQSPHHITWYSEAEGLPGHVMCLWIDKKENDEMWVGTSEGIFQRNSKGNEDRFANLRSGQLPKFKARRIYGTTGKILYFGSSSGGLFAYLRDKGQVKHYRAAENIQANKIYAIIKESRGRLLIGTWAGLYFLENETLKKFKENGFYVDRPVFFILEDSKQRLWFGTDNGVVRWDGKTRREYAAAHGLMGNETNRAAAIEDSKGKIWIGTNRSVSIYDEQFDTNEPYNPPPILRLLTLEISNRRIPFNANTPVHLSYGDNTLVFHFRGISFMDENAIRFKNRLEGFEKEWSRETYPYKQILQYSNLPAGTYRFHLKARNALGTWSDVVTSPKIIIMPPFYRTWWFILLVVLLLAVFFYGILRFLAQGRYAALLEKQVEERTHKLQAAEQQYRNLCEESKDVVFMTSREGKLMAVNPAGVELLGLESKEEALNIDHILGIYYRPADRAAFQEEIEEKGYVKDYEVTLKRKDGEPLSSLVTATLVRDQEGKVVGYRGIIRDMTRQKKLEQQLIQAQKMEAIGTLAGGIAHDFNNILGAIVGYTELALDDLPEGTRVRKNVEHILIASERAADLVKQILAFSRQSEQQRKPLILGIIVREALKLLRSSLPATIEIQQDIRSHDGVILGDPTQIHQVLMNLAANAAHAMEEKGGILKIELSEVQLDEEAVLEKLNIKPGLYLRLTVSDTGHGIPRVVMKRIFEPYFTTKKTGEGTGMGLAVIHGIIKSHGGDISVYSQPGKGATFHVFFPRIQADVHHEDPLKPQAPGGNERILLVDDELSLIEVVTKLLEGLGYYVVGRSNPLEALETFQKQPSQFDLIICDITMPRMTGIQLAKKIKHIKPNIPIILCSGLSTARTTEQIKALGVDDFIMKPIIRGELARIVRQVLDNVKDKANV